MAGTQEHSEMMNDISICFVNVNKENAQELAQMIRNLGGKVKKEPTKSTHCILQSVKGPKYRVRYLFHKIITIHHHSHSHCFIILCRRH